MSVQEAAALSVRAQELSRKPPHRDTQAGLQPSAAELSPGTEQWKELYHLVVIKAGTGGHSLGTGCAFVTGRPAGRRKERSQPC